MLICAGMPTTGLLLIRRIEALIILGNECDDGARRPAGDAPSRIRHRLASEQDPQSNSSVTQVAPQDPVVQLARRI